MPPFIRSAFPLLFATHLIAQDAIAADNPAPDAPDTNGQHEHVDVTFVIPWHPGDLEDTLTRAIAQRLIETTDLSATVINRPDASKGPFQAAVDMASQTDGSTWVGSFFNDIPVVGPSLGIEALKPFPFEPLGAFVTYPFVIAARSDAAFTTLDELVEHTQDHEVEMGHYGPALMPTRLAFALADKTGFYFTTHQSYTVLNCDTLVKDPADIIVTSLQELTPCLDDIRVLASFSPDRLDLAPDAPRIGEISSRLNTSMWNGLFVDADTPDDIRDQITAAAEFVTQSAEAQDLSQTSGAPVYWQGARATRKRIAQDIKVRKRIETTLSKIMN